MDEFRQNARWWDDRVGAGVACSRAVELPVCWCRSVRRMVITYGVHPYCFRVRWDSIMMMNSRRGHDWDFIREDRVNAAEAVAESKA